MRKYGLYLLIAVSLMTGCQKKDTVTLDTAAETTQESSETGSTAEREPESAVESISGTDQNGNTGADAQTDRFALIPIAVSGEYDGEWDDTDQTPIITSRCDKVYVQGDGYDALKHCDGIPQFRYADGKRAGTLRCSKRSSGISEICEGGAF